jgi:hypothetical protein
MILLHFQFVSVILNEVKNLVESSIIMFLKYRIDSPPSPQG